MKCLNNLLTVEHQNPKVRQQNFYEYDIALITIPHWRGIVLNNFVKPICIWPYDSGQIPDSFNNVSMTGFGEIRLDDPDQVLDRHLSTVGIAQNSKCTTAWPFWSRLL